MAYADETQTTQVHTTNSPAVNKFLDFQGLNFCKKKSSTFKMSGNPVCKENVHKNYDQSYPTQEAADVEQLIYPTPLIDFFRRSLYIAFP